MEGVQGIATREAQRRPLPLAIAVFVAAALLTGLTDSVVLGRLGELDSPDYHSFYAPVADRILSGQGITTPDGSPAVRYPPGYPLLLAGSLAAGRWVGLPDAATLSGLRLLLAGLTALLLFLIARSVWGDVRALAAPLVWLLYPPSWFLTVPAGSEVAFIPVFLAGLYFFWRALTHPDAQRTHALLSGLLIGVAMLIRPIALVLTPILLAGLLWRRRVGTTPEGSRTAALLLIGSLVVVAPWEAWIYSRTHQVLPLSSGAAPSIRDGLTFAVKLKGWRQGVSVPSDVRAVMQSVEREYQTLGSPGAIARLMAAQARENPVAVAKLYGLKALRSWYATDSQRHETVLLLLQALFLSVVLIGGIATWQKGGEQRLLACYILILTGGFWLMTVLVLSVLRYMVPAMALLFTLTPGTLWLLAGHRST